MSFFAAIFAAQQAAVHSADIAALSTAYNATIVSAKLATDGSAFRATICATFFATFCTANLCSVEAAHCAAIGHANTAALQLTDVAAQQPAEWRTVKAAVEPAFWTAEQPTDDCKANQNPAGRETGASHFIVFSLEFDDTHNLCYFLNLIVGGQRLHCCTISI